MTYRNSYSSRTSGLIVLAGAAGIALSLILPWVKFTGRDVQIGANFFGTISLSTTQHLANQTLRGTKIIGFRSLILVAVVGLLSMALMLRRRRRGLLLRFLLIAISGLIGWFGLWFINYLDNFVNNLSTAERLTAVAGDFSISAQFGLYLLLGATLVVLAGTLVPPTGHDHQGSLSAESTKPPEPP
jgi:hypothetical protein